MCAVVAQYTNFPIDFSCYINQSVLSCMELFYVTSVTFYDWFELGREFMCFFLILVVLIYCIYLQ